MEFGPILRSMRRSKVRYGLIVAEVALTLAIVANCVNMIRDSKRELAIQSGFDDENIIRVMSRPFAPAFKEDGYLDNSLRNDLAVLRAIPGVVAVTNSRFLPWQGGGSSMETRPLGSKGQMLRNQVYNADEGTLDALGAKLIAGRNFTRAETESETLRMRQLFASSRRVGADGTPAEKTSQDIIVSKAFAELLFPGQNALGKRTEDNDGDTYTIVGIIDRFYNPYGWPIHEYVMFFSGYSRNFAGGAPFLVRAAPGRKAEVLASIEKALIAADPGRNVQVQPLTEVKARFQSRSALLVTILSILIVLLLFITSLGIVGLTVFSVAERTRQIGTRRALGAQRADILRYFLLENWIVTTLGLVLGVGLAFGLNLALVARVNSPRMEPALIVGGIFLLWMAGLAATFFPARRGARVAPAIATRNV